MDELKKLRYGEISYLRDSSRVDKFLAVYRPKCTNLIGFSLNEVMRDLVADEKNQNIFSFDVRAFPHKEFAFFMILGKNFRLGSKYHQIFYIQPPHASWCHASKAAQDLLQSP